MREAFFTPTKSFDRFLSNYRYSRVFNTIASTNTPIETALDMGCGSGHLVQILKQKGMKAKGVDIQPGPDIIKADLNQVLPIEDDSIDLVTSLANLEHLDKPMINLKEIHRILKPGGICILTTPSTAAKPVLEFLAYKLKCIDRSEIDDHKMYFSKKLLTQYFAKAGFTNTTVQYFQFGFNLHAVAIK